MTVVIADSCPLNYLTLIGSVDVLRRLYGTVVVPEQVICLSNDIDNDPQAEPTIGSNIVAMHDRMVRGIGLALAVGYATFIAWLYIQQPQSAAEVTGGFSASIGSYRIDPQAFEDGMRFFRRDQFVESRTAFERADPARQDARTQFYVAYTYYRQGWGRFYQDDELFAQGLEAVNRAIARAPGGRIRVDDPGLQMRSGEELKAELEAGLRRDASDFNPARLLGRRK